LKGQSFGASAPASGASGQPKQRVRARRGQATDPHSIAERVRFSLAFVSTLSSVGDFMWLVRFNHTLFTRSSAFFLYKSGETPE